VFSRYYCAQVQIYDQTIFESYKSPGQFFHASSAWKIDHFTIGLVRDEAALSQGHRAMPNDYNKLHMTKLRNSVVDIKRRSTVQTISSIKFLWHRTVLLFILDYIQFVIEFIPLYFCTGCILWRPGVMDDGRHGEDCDMIWYNRSLYDMKKLNIVAICAYLLCVCRCSSELNLGIQASGFTVVKNCRPTEELKKFLTVSNHSCSSAICRWCIKLRLATRWRNVKRNI